MIFLKLPLVFKFETRSPCVAQAGLGLILWFKRALNSLGSCLSPLNSVIATVSHNGEKRAFLRDQIITSYPNT